MSPLKPLGQRLLAYALCLTTAFPAPLYAAATDIRDAPLAQPATSVKPNMLLILDDSGSMARQFTPDYVFLAQNNCFDALDSGSTINATPETCYPGDPPAMTPDFNTQYYNPEIRYFPAVTFDGTSKGDMDAAATSNWTAVKTDNVSTSTNNVSRKSIHLPVDGTGDTGVDWARRLPGTALQTMNLAAGFPDRVWCKAQGDNTTDTARCKTNSSYTYPNPTPDPADGLAWGYGVSSSSRKYALGAPYYYRILPTEHCTDITLTTCVTSASPTITHTVPAIVRYCNSTAHTTCKGKRDPDNGYIFPKFLGTLNPGVPSSSGTRSRGKITLTGTGADAGAPTITKITITRPNPISPTAIDVYSGSLTTAAVNSTAGRFSAAKAIRDAINLGTGTHGYIACVPGGGTGADTNFPTTTISCSNAPGNTNNDINFIAPPSSASPTQVNTPNDGSTIAITAPALTPTAQASATWTICTPGSNSSCANTSTDKYTTIRVNGVNIADPAAGAVCGASCTASSMAAKVRTAVTSYNGIVNHGYTATGAGATVIITAPAGTGAEQNGFAVTAAGSGLSSVNTPLAGGVTPGDITAAATSFGSGVNESVFVAAARENVGNFVRTNIVSGTTHTKYPTRTDCSGTIPDPNSCTYEEEMTNFANWFAYYRTRIMMAKTALGRAFLILGSSFRVGFMTINFSSTHYLAVNDFTTTASGQKDTWYGKLYNAMTGISGSTPLRGSLSRAGQYYANRRGGATPAGSAPPPAFIDSSMGPSPITMACQPSFAILTSDGYWNDSDSDADTMTAGSIGNQDSGTGTPPAEIVPWATKAIGAWDGSPASNTLADVAMYYYKNDLRGDLTDQVPPSGIDTAPHQHMTTFTVGMGLAGTLNFDPNYQTASSGDFVDIKQGTKLWPVPVSGDETTLDDMWHAAVNGRGRFFSAQDPNTLADGISETLNAVQARIGAGAAAATSNLQPVAGDNFAFTAQYQTVEWSGDLKARTIELETGAVATRELWSAATQLSLRTHQSRRIFTYDVSDTIPTATITVDSVSRTQNANKLRSFCPADAPLASYAQCDDGGLLTTAEMNDYFDPDGGLNSKLDQANTWSGDLSGRDLQADPANLIHYLRGDRTNEMLTPTSSTLTDLYRRRTGPLLGDIVNAQPAYVKTPPFKYLDPYYDAYKTAQANRKGRVYVAANDGMLHAFHTDPDNLPYYQTAGITSLIASDDHFSNESPGTGTLSTDGVTGEGAEDWAYIPSLVIPKVKRLAELYYATNHAYTVDGTPLISDVCFGHTSAATCSTVNNWRTILVAGLNNGGRGYYALDITDPANPKALWELKGGSDAACIAADSDVTTSSGQTGDCHIGKTFGNPVIAKLPSTFLHTAHRGKWVVLITSGHNNISPGDGIGHFYVVEAQTGKILMRKSTTFGDSATPSGLSRINAWVDNAAEDNTALSIYGGDLLGNVFRFQLADVTKAVPADDDIPSGSIARLATVKDPANAAQPITVRPELGTVSGRRVVYLGTGRFLGDADKTSIQRQTVYAIKDEMTRLPVSVSGTAIVSTTRAGPVSATTISGFVRQTVEVSAGNAAQRSIATPATVDFATDNGFFIDLPDGGVAGSLGPPLVDPIASERVNVDPVLQLGTLVIASNVPNSDTCSAGGYGFVNFFDYRSGSYIPGATANMVSQKISASVIVGINVVQLPGGTVKTIVTTADNQQLTQDTPVAASSVLGRRVSWRELIAE